MRRARSARLQGCSFKSGLAPSQRESQRWKAATEPPLVTKNLLGSPSPTLPSLQEIKSPRAGRHGFSAADSGLLLSRGQAGRHKKPPGPPPDGKYGQVGKGQMPIPPADLPCISPTLALPFWGGLKTRLAREAGRRRGWGVSAEASPPPTDLPLFLSLRWSASRTVLIDRLFVTLPGVT